MNEKINDEIETSKPQENHEDFIGESEQEKQSEVSTEDSLKKNEEVSKELKNPRKSDDIDTVTIDTLKKELEENKDKLLRSLAESENTRKQMEKIRIETNKYGIQPLAREILNVVDNFNRALSLKDDKNENALEEGLNLIQKEILSILEKFNVKKIKALGEDFNANFHQAMFEKETNEYQDGKVCEIVQDGYIFHDRLLRPVLVGVAKKSKINKDDDKIKDNENTKNEEKD